MSLQKQSGQLSESDIDNTKGNSNVLSGSNAGFLATRLSGMVGAWETDRRPTHNHESWRQ